MEVKFRCDCPITSALDILGDKWMLVIVKQMLLEGKETFKDFTESEEAIATNILTNKLKFLEKMRLITKSKLPNNKKTNIYHLTEKGLGLAPTIIDLAIWSYDNLIGVNPLLSEGENLATIKSDKAAFVAQLQEAYRNKVKRI